MSLQVEKKKLLNEKRKEQNAKETLQNSRDFKEITLAVTLLAGIGATLLKVIDLFTHNTVNDSFQGFLLYQYQHYY